uniref:Uncharacterized protein n=1 Tax=Zea mays TaxID=4577 RepID=A0A804MP37_MAIZE
MRCAGVLLPLLLLSLSAASTAEAHKERLGDAAAALSTGRRWLTGRKTLAAPGRDEVVEGAKKSTGANTAHVHGAETTVEVAVVGRRSRTAGLVPFCADYRTPRTHPPRNN